MTTKLSLFFSTFSLTLLLGAALATAENVTSIGGDPPLVTTELRYDGCAPGGTIGECIKAMHEKEDQKDAMVMRRIMEQTGSNNISYRSLEPDKAVYNGGSAARFLGAVNSEGAECTTYTRCKKFVN